jgi:hydroxymethylpyrimidine/phosphomethylpyrimidine kinase
MNHVNIPHILSIAGSDSGGGAGIQADLKTIAALGGHGMTAITAITAQNTLGVMGIEEISLEMIAQQIDAVFSDFRVDVIKTGMLANPLIAELISQKIKEYQPKFVVIDPVLRATSGANLGGGDTARAMKEKLFLQATVITPNLIEAGILLGREIKLLDDMPGAAKDLLEFGSQAVLLKGGHLEGQSNIMDILAYHDGNEVILKGYRHDFITTKNTHGTGCSLASAIAVGLGNQLTVNQAVEEAIAYVQEAIKHAKELHMGRGPGPLWHAFQNYPQG